MIEFGKFVMKVRCEGRFKKEVKLVPILKTIVDT